MNLKQIRKSHNMTQDEVAKAINTSRVNYNRYELEIVEPSIQTLTSLADLFHLTIDELVGHQVPYLIDKSLLSNSQLELIEKIKKLNDSNCKLVNAYIIGLLTAEEEKQNIIKKFKGE